MPVLVLVTNWLKLTPDIWTSKVKTLQCFHWLTPLRHRILKPCVGESIYSHSLPWRFTMPSSMQRHLDTVYVPLRSMSHAADVDTHPSSVIPSRNSFLVNSHCVAARNFHATTSTVMLAGSSERSSQNCWIPSIPILFSSWGSIRGKYIREPLFFFFSWTPMTSKEFGPFLEELCSSDYISCFSVKYRLTFVAIVELLQLLPVYWGFHGFLTVKIWVLKVVVGSNF